MKYYINLIVLALVCITFGQASEWNSIQGKKWKEDFVQVCIDEAIQDMGADYNQYKSSIKDYCVCMADITSESYPTPGAADSAAENNEEEFYAKIIQYGGETCITQLMTAVMGGNLEIDRAQINENESEYWKTPEGQKWKEDSIKECVAEAQADMGAQYYEYANEITEYCSCMMDVAAKVYPSPDEASWAAENNEEEFYATIIQYGVDDCLAILMKMMMELEGLEEE